MKSYRYLLAFSVTVFLSFQMFQVARADWEPRNWKKVAIPGAVCGNGQQYSIFVSERDPKKIAFYFAGGGACWDYISCFKIKTHSGLGMPSGPSGGYILSGSQAPLNDHTTIYLPYCTADVHMGAHVLKYLKKKVNHVGRINIERTFEYIKQTQLVDLPNASQVVVYGLSAGALGALTHAQTIAPYLSSSPLQDKVLIADAPGLHFGKLFWIKFPKQLIRDYSAALGRMNYKVNTRNGNLAQMVPNLCKLLPDWRVGILQPSMDALMSFFGATDPITMHKTMFSSKGVFGLTKDPTDNCSVWSSSFGNHGSMLAAWSAKKIPAGGVVAYDYFRDLILGRELGRQNHDGRRELGGRW